MAPRLACSNHTIAATYKQKGKTHAEFCECNPAIELFSLRSFTIGFYLANSKLDSMFCTFKFSSALFLCFLCKHDFKVSGLCYGDSRIIGAFNGTNSIEEISQALKANDFYIGITLVFASYALHAFLLVNKIRNIIGRQCDLKLVNSTFGTEYKAKHWRDKQQITEVATYIKLGKEDVAQLISNPDFSADERRVIIDFVHYGLTVDQIRSYVENEKHFTLEGLQYGLYKMLFTKEK